LRQALLDRAAEVIQQQGIEALTLRGLARDLGVSHGAPNRHFKTRVDLLAAIATDGYSKLTAATLDGATNTKSDDAWIRLNGMGRGYLHWALDNPASFTAISHPDLARHEDDDLKQALEIFGETVRQAIADAQKAGRYPDVNPMVLEVFTNSVPMGAAMMLTSGRAEMGAKDQNHFVVALIEMVVPIAGRG
jgi:AcrR family transcriptional regulator